MMRIPTRAVARLRPLLVVTLGATLAATFLSRASASLDDYLARAGQSIGVVTSELELGDAERSLERVESDPLALRPDIVQARQRAELAAAEAEEALLQAYRDVAASWARVREAELQVELASAARDLAERALAVAELRRERGSATDIDVRSAATELLDAERSLATARDGAALARADLAGVTGLAVTGVEDDDAPRPLDRARFGRLEVPSSEALEAASLRVPALLSVRQGVELSDVARSLLDPSFASRRQIEEAELQQEQALAGEREARRGVALQVSSLRNALVSALEGDRIAQEALAGAREREAVERRRLAAGLVAEITVDGVRLETMQALLQAVQAEHALVDAILALQVGALFPMEGWHAF